MRIIRIHRLIAIAAVVIATAGLAAAQAGHGIGRMSGLCIDLEGNPLENIKVQIVFSQNQNLKFDTVSSKKGEWSFLGLGTGTWNLTATGAGYEQVTQAVYISQLDTNPKVSIKLKKTEKTGGGFIQDQSSLAFLDKGNQLFREQKFDEAISQFEQFLEKNPAAYQVRISIADCYREKGEFEKATALYNEIIERSKTDSALGKEMMAKGLAGLGNIMIKQNKLDAAQEYFKQSIACSPKDEILAYNVGEIYFSNQGIEDALKYFELASQIKPQWPDPYLKLGYVYLNKADNASAVAKFEKFLTLEPEGERAALVKNILNAIKR